MSGDLRGFIRELTRLVLPIALQSLLSALVSASDAFMLGFLDQASLSAISLATQITFVLSLFHSAFMIGAAVLAAQYWGISDRHTVEKVLGVSLLFSLPVSAVFFLAARFRPEWLMRLFTDDAELIGRGAEYLRIVSWSFLMSGYSQMFLNIMKNSGRVGRAALYGSVAVILNILLNLVLIFGLFGAPALGIRGAAIATTVSRGAELALCLAENARPGQVRLRRTALTSPEGDLARRYWHYTAPVLANMIAWGGGVAMFSVILGHLGSDAVAANSVTNIIKNIMLCFCTGIGGGTSIMLGNQLGAGELEKARRSSVRLLTASVLFGALAGMLVLICVSLVARSSTALSPRAVGYLRKMGYISAYYVIASSFNSTLVAGVFTAGGDTRFGFWCDLINMWGVILPVSALAAFRLHAPVMTVYFLLNLDEIGKIPFEVAHYRKGKWIKNLTDSGE